MSHAAAAPSSAGTWMTCPASITKADGRTRPSSRYAREGSAAHRIAEMVISGDMFPPPKITIEGEEFIVGLPMLRALNGYVDYVQRLHEIATVHVEKKVSIPTSGGWVWGTTDCAAANLGHAWLEIVDLKFGMGVPVPPTSAQLKIYGLGAWQTLWPGQHFQTVSLTVFQPRLDPKPNTITMKGSELKRWGDTELMPAVQRIIDGDETEVAGPHCRFCVRKNECTAFAVAKNMTAHDVFNDGGLDTPEN